MKAKFKFIIMAVAIVFIAVSCGKASSVDAALSQIEKAIDKVEKNKTSMTEADWEAFSEELEQPAKVLSEALESNQVGAMKKIKISAVMLRYAAIIGEAAMHTMTDKMVEMHLADSIAAVSNQLQEVLDGDEMKQAMQNLQKAVEDLQEVEIGN